MLCLDTCQICIYVSHGPLGSGSCDGRWWAVLVFVVWFLRQGQPASRNSANLQALYVSQSINKVNSLMIEVSCEIIFIDEVTGYISSGDHQVFTVVVGGLSLLVCVRRCRRLVQL